MSELDRRIEDGINYEHIPAEANRRQKELDDEIPSARGVFAGYRYTSDEYSRLKSADPLQ
jgi:hypothetical protein